MQTSDPTTALYRRPLEEYPLLAEQQFLLTRLLQTTHSFAFYRTPNGLEVLDLDSAQRLFPLEASSPQEFGEQFQERIFTQDRDHREALWQAAQQACSAQVRTTIRVRNRQGEWHWFQEEAHLSFALGSWHALGVFTDVSESKRNFTFQAGQTRILKLLTEHQPQAVILDTLNLLIEELIPGSLTGILGYDPQTNTIYDLSGPSLPAGYRASIHGLEVTPTRGSCGAALSRRSPVIVTDIGTDPLWAEFRALAIGHYNLHACWSHPILSESGLPVGTFAIYHQEPHTPTPWEREFLAGAAYLARVILEFCQSANQVRYQASHDALTRLPNRFQFNQDLAQSLEQAQSTHSSLSLLFLDMDRFKQANDAFGHSFGDVLLTTTAERLQKEFHDGIYRMGGDEFTILLQDTDAAEAQARITQIKSLLIEPIQWESHAYTPSFTIGISDYPGHANDAKTLLTYADIALHQAKADLPGSIRCFDPHLAERLAQKTRLERDLREALGTEAFCLHYQPIVATSSQRVIGVEALLRWNHPELGIITPDLFIPLAEETGLILPLGDWILRQACQQARLWELAGTPIPVSINVSARQLLQSDFIQKLHNILNTYQVDPKLIALELTETAILQHGKSAARTLSTLKNLGVQLHLDDFGTGFSSLVFLRNYRMDRLKIAQLFVHNVTRRAHDAAIVRGVIEMGHALNMEVIAEGIEDEATLALLKELHCDGLQGFLFSPPLPPESLVLPTR